MAAKAAPRGPTALAVPALAAETDFKTQKELANTNTKSKMALAKPPEVLGLELLCVTFACA